MLGIHGRCARVRVMDGGDGGGGVGVGGGGQW